MVRVDVTVVIPTRNRPALLERALESVLRQTLEHYEVIVVDDGSDAAHAAAYRDLVGAGDPRVHLLQPLQPGQQGSGPSASRNRGIDAGQGRYLAFLDDDDTWTWEGYLKTAVDILDKTGAELFCGDMQGYRNDVLTIDTWFPDRRPFHASELISNDPSTLRSTRAAFVEAARHRNLNPNPVVVSRRLVERAGGFLITLRFAEDIEFLMRMVDRVETVLFCDKPLARYKLPEGDAHSLSMNNIEQHLQSLAAAEHLLMVARSAEVREQARRLESWTLRLLSDALREEGRQGAAVRMALQALLVRPTLGGVLHTARTLFGFRRA